MVIWRLSDAKPGHDQQSRGLAQALSGLCTASVLDVPAHVAGQLLLRRRSPDLAHLPRPDLVIGAGHRTHLGLLTASHVFHAFSVVLMQPSLPTSWFGLCIVPRHDRPRARANIVVSEGVLNTITPSPSRDAGRGIMLIGGPSRHHGWDERALLEQMMQVLGRTPSVQWLIGDSRRTPRSTRPLLSQLAGENAAYVPAIDTPPDWVGRQLTECGRAWVTEDSVSMIFEALTAGASTGVFSVPRRRESRVSRAVDDLLQRGRAFASTDWQSDEGVATQVDPLNEARRCASIVLERWHAMKSPGGR